MKPSYVVGDVARLVRRSVVLEYTDEIVVADVDADELRMPLPSVTWQYFQSNCDAILPDLVPLRASGLHFVFADLIQHLYSVLCVYLPLARPTRWD